MIDEYTGIPTGAKVSVQFEGGEPENAKVIGYNYSRYLLLDKKGFIFARSDLLPDGYIEWKYRQGDGFPGVSCGVVFPFLIFQLETDSTSFIREDRLQKWSFVGDEKNDFNKLRFDYVKNLIMRARREI